MALALANSVLTACLHVPYNDEAAFDACTKALQTVRIPFLPEIAWGGDQPDRQIKNKALTRFNAGTFQPM